MTAKKAAKTPTARKPKTSDAAAFESLAADLASAREELSRVAGPVCTIDGKRAIEHAARCSEATGSGTCGRHLPCNTHPQGAIAIKDHEEWPEGAEWWRDRGRTKE